MDRQGQITMKLYKHINNTDVAIDIIKKFYVKEKALWKFKVMWWNVGECHDPWPMNITQQIEIPKEVWEKEWKLYEGVEND